MKTVKRSFIHNQEKYENSSCIKYYKYIHNKKVTCSSYYFVCFLFSYFTFPATFYTVSLTLITTSYIMATVASERCKSLVWYTLLLCKDKCESLLKSESGKPAIDMKFSSHPLYNRQLCYIKAVFIKKKTKKTITQQQIKTAALVQSDLGHDSV